MSVSTKLDTRHLVVSESWHSDIFIASFSPMIMLACAEPIRQPITVEIPESSGCYRKANYHHIRCRYLQKRNEGHAMIGSILDYLLIANNSILRI